MKILHWLGAISYLIVAGSSTLGESRRFPKFGPPIVIGESIIFAGPGWESHRIICINRQDGKKLWEISDSSNALRPAFVLDQQIIITAGSAIERLNPQTGNRKPVFQTDYPQPLLQYFSGGMIYCLGDHKLTPKLSQIDSSTWQSSWESPTWRSLVRGTAGVTHIIAEGENVLLCEWEVRRPLGMTNGAFQVDAAAFVGVAKSSGKVLWSLGASHANWLSGVAIKDWFVLSSGDEILCVRQANGAIVKRIPHEGNEGSLGTPLIDRTDDVIGWSSRGVLKLSVLDLSESLLFWTASPKPASCTVFDNVVVGKNLYSVEAYSLTNGEKLWQGGQWNWDGVYDGYIYFSETGRKVTSVNRLDIRTGAREKLYEEPIPDARR